MIRRVLGLSSAILGLGLVVGCHHDQQTAQTVPPATASAEMGANAGGYGAGAGAAVTTPGEPPPINSNYGSPGQYGSDYGSGSAAMSSQPETGLACPMEVPGAKVAIAEVKGQAALDFTTNGDVIDLRRRVRAFGASQNVGAIAPNANAGAGDTQGSGGREMQGAVAHVQAKATFEDLPNGVRVIFTPVDEGQVEVLRSQLATQVAQLNQGDCSSLEINGVQWKAPNNEEHKANRVPQTPSPAEPNPDTSP
jgi:hypothetical protein